MKNNQIKQSLNELSYTDIYSLILFAIYKLDDDPKYSTLSELVYTMDKDSLFNFLECFGGLTIKVPTVKELMVVINALLLYQDVNVEGVPFNDAIKNVNLKEYHLKDIKDAYEKICNVLSQYSFKRN